MKHIDDIGNVVAAAGDPDLAPFADVIQCVVDRPAGSRGILAAAGIQAVRSHEHGFLEITCVRRCEAPGQDRSQDRDKACNPMIHLVYLAHASEGETITVIGCAG